MNINLNKKVDMLNQLPKNELEKSPLFDNGEGADLVYDGFLNNVWSHAEYLSEKYFDLNCTFSQKRQLFLELVEYYMEKGLLRFEGEYSTYSSRYNEPIYDEITKTTGKNLVYVNEEEKIWDKETSVKDTIEYLDKVMPKSKEEFDDFEIGFFYSDCPPAYWWDEYEQKWI